MNFLNSSFRVISLQIKNSPSWKRCISTGSYCSNQKCEPDKTVLFDFHKSHGGKMVDFAGWCMPVVYDSLGISASHKHTRTHASIFDVSHMLQTKIYGKDKIAFIESLVVADVKSMKENSGGLSVFLNENGGIMDDVIINTTNEDYLYVVSNAGCSEKIKAHLQSRDCILFLKFGSEEEEATSLGRAFQHLAALLKNDERHWSEEQLQDWKDKDVSLEHIDNGLIALQGPSAAGVLSSGTDIDLTTVSFMQNRVTDLFGIPGCRITRCGYTGEDGFEISIPHDRTVELTEKLLNHDEVEMAGLGARDSLRLEAGLCLYGNDIDETTTPAEASLTWTIAKSRRKEANFPGAEKILQQIKDKPTKRRIGLVVTGGIARQGAVVEDADGNEIGHVTSGCPAPSIGKNIAMAYLPRLKCKVGTEVNVRVRKRILKAKVSKMPFVPAQYYFAK